MARHPPGPVLRQPLSWALGTRAKVAVLRVLTAGGDPVTQRELARRVGLQHRSVQLALADLVALGLVRRLEGGRDFLVSFEPAHRLAASLQAAFDAEAELFLGLRRRLVAIAAGVSGGSNLTLALVGSVARGEERLASDLDLLAVAGTSAEREAILDRLVGQRAALQREFGVRLNPVGYTRGEARRLWRTRQPPLRDMARDAIHLCGPALHEVLR